jgi:hypothetical protein
MCTARWRGATAVATTTLRLSERLPQSGNVRLLMVLHHQKISGLEIRTSAFSERLDQGGKSCKSCQCYCDLQQVVGVEPLLRARLLRHQKISGLENRTSALSERWKIVSLRARAGNAIATCGSSMVLSPSSAPNFSIIRRYPAWK